MMNLKFKIVLYTYDSNKIIEINFLKYIFIIIKKSKKLLLFYDNKNKNLKIYFYNFITVIGILNDFKF